MTNPPTPPPVWTLSAPYQDVEQAVRTGSITFRQWEAYRAIWFYGAPRFSDLVDWPRIRDINAQLDTVHGPVPACLTCNDTQELILGPECGNLAGCMAICGDCAPETVGERGVW